MSSNVIRFCLAVLNHATMRSPGRRRVDDRGQATAEYALLLLGVAAIALLVAAWAANSGQVGALLDRVFETISTRVG